MNKPEHPQLEDYIQCALWSSTDDQGEPLDDLDAELDETARQQMNADLSAFFDEVDAIRAKYEGEEFPNPEQIAHDFWLTRNSHGAGFWDRGLGDLGRELTEMAHAWGSADLYLGDDGRIYHA